MFSRRRFFQLLGFGAASAVVLRSGIAWAKKVAFGVDKAEALQTVGGSAVMKVKDVEILFIRDTETTVKAFSPHCTHADCPVAYNSESQLIECSCHGSKFDLAGSVLNGPAELPLPSYASELRDGKVVVTLPS